MPRILVVDDEDSVRYSFEKLLRPPEHEVLGARDGQEALRLAAASSPDLVILDIQMPGMSGLEVLQHLKRLDPRLPVLVITAHGDSDRVIAAMKHGAYEYVEKPFDVPRMKALIDEVLEAGRLMRTQVRLDAAPADDASADRIIGGSAVMRDVCKLIGRVAASDASVLIIGESGTGKELVARAVHQYSEKAHMPFLAVNCAAIPETLLESELFGYERGAFTGANKRRIGKFEQCDGGTLFLDEIGDMGFSTQAKLLRVLQEGTFERLGGDETIRVRVRVIAATNQNLEQAITEKRFREDLYYRLKVVTIPLPPLRQRREDLPELIDYFMAKHGPSAKDEHVTLAPETRQLLLEYDWPGNVREMENVLRRAILLRKGSVVRPGVVLGDLRGGEAPAAEADDDERCVRIPEDLEAHQGQLYDRVVAELERKLIVAALQQVGGNQVRAAQLLGVSRVMLHDRIKRYGIRTEVHVRKV